MQYEETLDRFGELIFLDRRSEKFKPCAECGTLTPIEDWRRQQGYCIECYEGARNRDGGGGARAITQGH